MKNNLISLDRKNLFILLFVIMCLFMFAFYSFSRIRTNPNSDWALQNPPAEGNRISHPNGLSIIAPIGWVSSLAIAQTDEELNGISLKGMKSQRHASIIKVFEYDEEDYKDKISNNPSYREITFQDYPAYEKTEINDTHNAIENPSTIEGEIYFLRDTKCYVILYYFPSLNTKPDNLSLYLNSFQITP